MKWSFTEKKSQNLVFKNTALHSNYIWWHRFLCWSNVVFNKVCIWQMPLTWWTVRKRRISNRREWKKEKSEIQEPARVAHLQLPVSHLHAYCSYDSVLTNTGLTCHFHQCFSTQVCVLPWISHQSLYRHSVTQISFCCTTMQLNPWALLQIPEWFHKYI